MRTHSIEKAKYSTCKLDKIICFHRTSRNKSRSISIFRSLTCFFHSSLVKISHILKAMIFQFRVDMFLRPNNEKITSDFIMCVCVYSKYTILQNSSKTNDFLCQISRLFVLLNIYKKNDTDHDSHYSFLASTSSFPLYTNTPFSNNNCASDTKFGISSFLLHRYRCYLSYDIPFLVDSILKMDDSLLESPLLCTTLIRYLDTYGCISSHQMKHHAISMHAY